MSKHSRTNSPQPPEGQAHGQKPGSVMVQKRVPAAEPSPREKLCATCGRPFALTPDQRFFVCPHCYKKSLPPRRGPRPGDTQLLIQIRCIECGAEEYIGFVPQDPQATYCKACFAKRKRKPLPE